MTNNFSFDFAERSEGKALARPGTQGTMGEDLNPRKDVVQTTSEAELELTSTVKEVLGLHGEGIRKLVDR